MVLEGTTEYKAEKRVEGFEAQIQSQAPVEIEDDFTEVPGNSEYAVEPEQVKILWNDIHDAHYASSWPERVNHGHLERTADHVMAGQKLIVPQEVSDDVLANSDFTEATTDSLATMKS